MPKETQNPVDPDKGVYENRFVYCNSTYTTNESDLDLVISVREKLPADAKLILVVDIDRPMCFHEIEPYRDAIVAAFGGVTEKAYASIISGEVEPSGLLTFQMPSGMQTVFEQAEDTPRDMDPYVDSEGNAYDFCFGLNWSGVIDDERVATYNVAPLTKCETPVEADA
ncbi:MAG: glycoside hydrolase family 3 C-terminal domain-containing protein [Atopobiaceae bacterium]|nr:glycoside hydrolase family 3 C-terminal domain-containing protein [Atopobiaceae bacterium]